MASASAGASAERPVPSVAEYAKFYGVSRAVLAAARPDAVIMHPGPYNHGMDAERPALQRPVLIDIR